MADRQNSGWHDERNARAYDAYARSCAMYRDTARDLVAIADVRRGMTAIDVACGTGLVGLLACEVLGANHSQVYFVDYSQAMLEKART